LGLAELAQSTGRLVMLTNLLLDRAVQARESRIVADTWQDVEPILEANKAARASPAKTDWGRHIATIPNVILVRWLNEEYARGNTQLRLFSAEFGELVRKKLADPEWKHLRVDR
jgi:hypothetical protein